MVCQCSNGLCTELAFIGQSCFRVCSFKLLLRLFLPLCSMCIATSSIVLPNWAKGETDQVAVGLFKCCNFTDENQTDCSPLSDCVPSDSKFIPLSKAAAGLQITYVLLHVVTIVLATISQNKKELDKRFKWQLGNAVIVFLAAAICYISIVVYLSGVIQTDILIGYPTNLSIHLTLSSCAVYLSYAAVCFKKLKFLICVPILTGYMYFVVSFFPDFIVYFTIIIVVLAAFVCFTDRKVNNRNRNSSDDPTCFKRSLHEL
ncbi:uncharacterized protein LOC128224828 [Mya arenaria]|uniref:uncharacterized protein LOC128224828 n=1 Tax=Mya arenaria TaxID=6604 RepID=UPI0022E9930B|nr:uncharacterized protein LOC128224828 [Mya arenaria]